MDEDIELFKDMTNKILETEVAPYYEQWEKNCILPRSLWNTLGEAGLLGVDVPEEYGGIGSTMDVSQMILRETARNCFGGLATGMNIHSNIVIPYIVNIGSEEQKNQWLPKLVTGEAVGAIAMTEPHTGSDLANIKTRAVMDGNEWVLNGSKIFITNGIHSDLVIVTAKTNPEAGAKGISLFLVDTKLQGFAKGKQLEKIGQHTSDTSELFFEDVRMPASALLGDENHGFFYLMQELPRERLGCSSQAMGACLGAIEMATEYVLERKAFGKRIADFQNTRFKLAEMKAQYEVCYAYYEKCIEKYKNKEMTVEDGALVKLTTTEAENYISNGCLQMFGGYGYSSEYPISRFFVDARIQTIYAGTSEIMKEIISRGILGR